ncbi:hypothetical protein COW36_03585 [bacterium (Candidatus Blackallbacteria) CG17_big_fil_post_rev_8_21_14_2_50_48_46]|uniref:Uncharacterized protein n=1 Tax=bacterium (Candidatus Blackallbacteria) CG17_big_fil_post_rev_8_21_14_2_50_48_46 TaxID=2014261 RepID=A0A2M7G8F4_9BACT|nr:MAG: hypothetical protein COW64_20755 [bacterium (Candidatus Blackallbacteria) CG18_big_fil_WC_8_21_14_2_50_49_26]PIW18386.1 MAG: hypothetical protein COW36_03585 [bacterium (Candidatus Blackallbacteria) CG17_big_fil_post_rev_8_21_14_2_50_48_46]PIW50545.1 MAG: hypothetical protein COW20_02010 [bacterium (Candidatus Blackallbacteria) CG13_big_fil_rev_8_21_14_2_50_49_14]
MMMSALDSSKCALGGWLWQELTDAQIEFTLFCDPFAGAGRASLFFKRRGFQVFACDVLQTHYWRNRASIENSSDFLTPEHYQAMIAPTDSSVHALFQAWGDHYFTKDEASWLGAWWQNINTYPEFSENANLKALAYHAVYLTMNYWLNYNQSYLQPKPLPAQEVLKHYVQQVNHFVCDNQMPNVSYCMDAYELVPDLPQDSLIWIYPPGMNGLRNTNRKTELAECWTRRTPQINLEGILPPSEQAKLGQPFHDPDSYLQALSQFLDKCQHIRLWMVGHNDAMGVSLEQIEELVQQKRTIWKKGAFEIPYPAAGESYAQNESVLVAVVE